jgi:hypothetical protein
MQQLKNVTQVKTMKIIITLITAGEISDEGVGYVGE